uniref:Uncharacterized protein n=1 Tax=viral metagenome TaxID=1070528 RepID=A0A6C0JK89_9ZZZZ
MHFEDDRFHPNDFSEEDEEYDYLNITARSIDDLGGDDESTVDTYRKNQRRLYEDSKKVDRGYHRIKLVRDGKPSAIEFYSTNMVPGTMIRDAVTGSKYNQFRVGTLNEHQFFKVTNATGQFGRDSVTMFYDSPEQFERHMKTDVETDIKSRWADKCIEIRSRNQ